MNISEYDRFLRITDNVSSDMWYLPSAFDIIKDPPEKFQTTSGAPTDTSKMLLREPAAFVRWSYLYFYSLAQTVKAYDPLDGTFLSTNSTTPIGGTENYLYRTLYSTFGVSDKHSRYLYDNLLKLVRNEISPSTGIYTYSLEKITTAELESKYPDYTYVGDDLESGSPLSSKIAHALASRARLARDILNGGFDGYVYRNLMLASNTSYVSQTKNCYVTKTTSTSSTETTTTFTITQNGDTISGTVDGTSPILIITSSPTDITTTAVIYLQFTFDYTPITGYSHQTGGGFPSVEWPPTPDTVIRTELHEITFTGSRTITNADVGISSVDGLIDKAMSALDRDFFELNSTNYKRSDSGSQKFVTNGAAKVGKCNVGVSYYAFLKHKFPISD